MNFSYCAFIRNQPKQNVRVGVAGKQAFLNNQPLFQGGLAVSFVGGGNHLRLVCTLF